MRYIARRSGLLARPLKAILQIQSVLCAPPGMIDQEGAGPPEGLGLLRSAESARLRANSRINGWLILGLAICSLGAGGIALGERSNLWFLGTETAFPWDGAVVVTAAGGWTTG